MQLRLVQNSQFGYIDPVYSTENENSGILKNLSMMCILSKQRNDLVILRKLIGNKELNIEPLVYPKLSVKALKMPRVMVNGKFIGWSILEFDQMMNMLLKMKDDGKIPFDVSITSSERWIYVDTSASRPIRPLLRVDLQTQRLKLRITKVPDDKIRTLMQYKCLEFVSPREQEYIKLASSEKVLNKKQKEKKTLVKLAEAATDIETKRTHEENLAVLNAEVPYTHCELDPMSFLGVVSSMIPLPNHNQAPRNTYQVSMSKQALGSMFQTGAPKFLQFPEDPLVYNSTQDSLHLDGEGPGNMLLIAMMALPGNEEDAFVINRSYLLFGGMRMCKIIIYTAKFRDSTDLKEYLGNPRELYKASKKSKFENIQDNGLPVINSYMNVGDCVIGKISSCSGSVQKSDNSLYIKPGDEGVVESISIVEHRQQQQHVIIKIRKTRVPQQGDKFAPRCAQKGTMGECIDEEFIHTDERGLTPDLICNPHCMPRRMTLTYIYEIMMSYVC